MHNEEYKTRLVERIVSYVEPWNREENEQEQTKELLEKDPLYIIEWLLDMLDNATC